jgi:hypothetical protein
MARAAEDAVLCKTFGLRGDIGSAEREPVYAFLLCARHRAETSAPGPQKSRLRRSIRLSSLPRVIIQHIARVLYVPQYVAEFDVFNDRFRDKIWFAPGALAKFVDHRLSDLAVTCLEFHKRDVLNSVRLLNPLKRTRTYIELKISNAWYGTTVRCGGVKLRCDCYDESAPDDREGEMVSVQVGGQHYYIPAFDHSWTWVSDPVIFGLLVDTIRGCVSFRMNGIDGPCLDNSNLDGFNDKTRTLISISGLPPNDVQSMQVTNDVQSMQVEVSSPPCPPSLRAAALKSPADHVLDGSLGAYDDED